MGRVQFVTPGTDAARAGRVVAVRIWLRVRSEITEQGYRDGRSLRYANRAFTPDTREATQRRLLVDRTVALRNLAP